MKYYIASCVFTANYPELSKRIQEYIIELGKIKIVRCCTPKYKLKQFAEKMPDSYREEWCSLPDSGDFSDGDTVYSICHNCTAILSETKPNVNVRSLWKLILEDKNFDFLDYTGRTVIVQDCWRSRDNREEQDAVRELLNRMNIRYEEMPECYEKTDFCGTTLYSACIPRNMVLAPDHFVKNADGKFIPHSDAEKKELMKSYCQRFEGKEVLSYCHYCQEGLELGGANAIHLAELLFPVLSEPREYETASFWMHELATEL